MTNLITALYDTETDGLLNQLTKMHCLGLKVGAQWWSCANQPGYDGTVQPVHLPGGKVIEAVHTSLERGLDILAIADIRVAHNGQDFDERAILRLYPRWKSKPGSTLIDTVLVSRALFPEIQRTGPNTRRIAPGLRQRHSLEAWGARLGEEKAVQFDAGDWSSWSPEMSAYMLQDVVVLERLFRFLMSCKPDPRMLDTEHGFAAIIRRQEQWGFTFDHTKALDLSVDLQRTERELESALITEFGEWWEHDDLVTVNATRQVKLPQYPNVTLRRFSPKTGKELTPYVGPPLCSYESGAQYVPVRRVVFQPGSREHVRKMLQQKHGWRPTKYTKPTKTHPKGQVQVDDDVLRALPWQEAQQLADYYVVMKVRGYLSTGKKAWLKFAEQEADGQYRIHGRVNTNRALSGRCGHMDPNMGQVPAVSKGADGALYGLEGGYGAECRSLFTARAGALLVGHDGSGLEYCMLASRVARWDGGAFADIVTNHKPHAWFRDEVVGTDIVGSGDAGYATMKTLGYAYIYGGGDERLGTIAAPLEKQAARKRLGREIKERMLSRFPALKNLLDVLGAYYDRHGKLVGLDGRPLVARKRHALLNLILQSDGAVVMKRSLIILDRDLQTQGLVPGVRPDGTIRDVCDYEFCANVHDEAQSDVFTTLHPDAKDIYLQSALASVPAAGRFYNLKCPLKAEAKTGRNWLETH